MSDSITALVEPLSADAPCGVDLEDTQLLSSFDAYRVFGSPVPLSAETPWREIRTRALETLGTSRDLRVLAHLAAAVIRLGGLRELADTLAVADRWLAEQWDGVFPRIDEDALLRKNALSCLADRMAIVDAVRRATIVAVPQLGAICLRDVELANNQIKPTEADTNVPNAAQIEAVLANSELAERQAAFAAVSQAFAALNGIALNMETRRDEKSVPDFDLLLKPLTQIEKLLRGHLPANDATVAGKPGGGGPTGKGGPGTDTGRPLAAGPIQTRQDAIRAIDAAAQFFRDHEPSSPVPLLLDRARRLVSKSFMEVLEDMVPDSLTQAKLIGGIKNDQA